MGRAFFGGVGTGDNIGIDTSVVAYVVLAYECLIEVCVWVRGSISWGVGV